ncbi:MAG TPA: PEGA domain-containing protein [Polyangia bacterium]|jgi:tetratricopeptide (TPR) repeat protein|nr:PEGA domain-containing protein [Polyangia bacterium]
MKAFAPLALALTVLTAGARPVQAQPPSAEAEAAKTSEAQAHFHRGIEFYKQGDFAAAQVEFTRAYEMVPNYKILYNLGQVSYQRRDHAAALRYFRKYLSDGVDAIPAERHHEVMRDIADLEQRVGRLQIDTPEDGAEVFIDDVLVGTTPLRALITVNGGARKIDLVARGGEHQSRQVDVGSGEVVRLPFPRLALRAPPATLPASPPTSQRTSGALATAPTAVLAAVAAVPSVVAAPARKSSFPWKSWSLTGLLAGGAAATGIVALTSKHDLDQQLGMFPADNSEIDYDRRRTRGFALATDGLLIGTAIMATISLYLTFRDPK